MAIGSHNDQTGFAALGSGREQVRYFAAICRNDLRLGRNSMPSQLPGEIVHSIAAPTSRSITLVNTTHFALARIGVAAVTARAALADSFQHTITVSLRFCGAAVAATSIGRPQLSTRLRRISGARP